MDTRTPSTNNQAMPLPFARVIAFVCLTPAATMWAQQAPKTYPAPIRVPPPQPHIAAPPPHANSQIGQSQIGRTGHWPTWTASKPPEKHHDRLGVGYVGYPWLAPFAYSTLPLVYDTSDGEDQPEAPQPPPRVEYGVPPPESYPEEVAENVPTPFRPTYGGAEPTPQPATTLIFNDGRPQIQVHNYALIGDTLYGLDTGAHQEIPLSQLNLPAMVDVNRKAGVDFSLPAK
jgi:hypothetical protein